jgi:hypothetical protein
LYPLSKDNWVGRSLFSFLRRRESQSWIIYESEAKKPLGDPTESEFSLTAVEKNFCCVLSLVSNWVFFSLNSLTCGSSSKSAYLASMRPWVQTLVPSN